MCIYEVYKNILTFYISCFVFPLEWLLYFGDFSFCKKTNRNKYCKTVTRFFPLFFIPILGRHEVQSWTTATKQSLCLLWQKVKVQLMLSMSFLIAVFWYCRRLYSFLAQLLKR